VNFSAKHEEVTGTESDSRFYVGGRADKTCSSSAGALDECGLVFLF
jgi:hypothetical protein